MKPNGSLMFFVSGTSTALVTYADDAETTANPTIVPVLTNGNIGNVFFTGEAKVIYFDEFDQQYAERDPVSSSSSAGGGGLSVWDNGTTYQLNNIVQGSNGKQYKSLTSANIGNDPTVSPANWEDVRFIGVWNTNITYVVGDTVKTTTGNLWKALTATSGNDPEADSGTNWLPAIDANKDPVIITVKANVVNITSWGAPQTSSFVAVSFESMQIDASANTVDVSLPILVAGDSFELHNQITSTFKVQILNPTQTIKGSYSDIAAGNNLELQAGNSIQLVAVSPTVLSIVGYSL